MSKRKYRLVTKRCKGCAKTITGHANKRFCGSRCKDRYWNEVNPRGYGLCQGIGPDDEHAGEFRILPGDMSTDALGQWKD